jgi:hypothetical protein
MHRTACLLVAWFLVGLTAAQAGEPPSPRWIVVTAPAFREAVGPLCELRKSQGLRVEVVQTSEVLTLKEIRDGDARKLADRVTQLCRESKGKCYVLLVGAVDAPWHQGPEKIVVPPLRGTVGRMKGQPTDHAFSPLDDDFAATVPVGRLPVRSAEEAQQLVRKILDFEGDTRPGTWRRRVTILAGAPEFNPVVDGLVERVALSRLDRIDPQWSGRAIFHNAQSRFCLPDDNLHDRARKYVEEGQALTLYLGHSNPEGFWAGRAKFLSREDWATVKMAHGGIFATFGCYGCQLTGDGGEAYGVAAIRNPSGPVAVLGSQGICFAAMVHLAADGLFESVLTGTPPERVGDAWLKLQKALAAGPISPITFRILDAVDGDANIPLTTQRREHLEMFTLLGDPALRLPAMPTKVALTVDGTIAPGATVTIHGEVPKSLEGAAVHLTLERPLSSQADLQPLPEKPGPERAKVMLANHDRANDYALFAKDTTVEKGQFEVKITLPEALPYPRLTLRAYAATKSDEGLGVLTVELKK